LNGIRAFDRSCHYPRPLLLDSRSQQKEADESGGRLLFVRPGSNVHLPGLSLKLASIR